MNRVKIRINYDLLEKINDSKTGLSLKRKASWMKYQMGLGLLATMPFNILLSQIADANFIKETIKDILFLLTCYGVSDTAVDYFLRETNKNIAKLKLILLLGELSDININTNYELLSNAYEYDSTYKFEVNDSKIPHLKEEKYIMVPVIKDGEEKEVSLVQEHVVGSKEYILSYGSPQKKLKLAYNPI